MTERSDPVDVGSDIGIRSQSHNGTDRKLANADRFKRFCQKTDGDCLGWSGWKDKDGYGMFKYYFGPGDRRDIRATHAALLIFKNLRVPHGLQENHRCDDPGCVNPDHLFIGTQKENMRDMIAKDRGSYGERRYNAKLSDGDVRAIRRRRSAGERVSDIAKDYPCSVSTVYAAACGHNWKHVGCD